VSPFLFLLLLLLLLMFVQGYQVVPLSSVQLLSVVPASFARAAAAAVAAAAAAAMPEALVAPAAAGWYWAAGCCCCWLSSSTSLLAGYCGCCTCCCSCGCCRRPPVSCRCSGCCFGCCSGAVPGAVSGTRRGSAGVGPLHAAAVPCGCAPLMAWGRWVQLEAGSRSGEARGSAQARLGAVRVLGQSRTLSLILRLRLRLRLRLSLREATGRLWGPPGRPLRCRPQCASSCFVGGPHFPPGPEGCLAVDHSSPPLPRPPAGPPGLPGVHRAPTPPQQTLPHGPPLLSSDEALACQPLHSAQQTLPLSQGREAETGARGLGLEVGCALRARRPAVHWQQVAMLRTVDRCLRSGVPPPQPRAQGLSPEEGSAALAARPEG